MQPTFTSSAALAGDANDVLLLYCDVYCSMLLLILYCKSYTRIRAIIAGAADCTIIRVLGGRGFRDLMQRYASSEVCLNNGIMRGPQPRRDGECWRF